MGKEVSWHTTPDGEIDWLLAYYIDVDMSYEKRVAMCKAYNKLYVFLRKLPDETPMAKKLTKENMIVTLFGVLKKVFTNLPLDKCELKSPKKYVEFFINYWDDYFPSFDNRPNSRESWTSSIANLITRTILSDNE